MSAIPWLEEERLAAEWHLKTAGGNIPTDPDRLLALLRIAEAACIPPCKGVNEMTALEIWCQEIDEAVEAARECQ